jgi:TolB-like protein
MSASDVKGNWGLALICLRGRIMMKVENYGKNSSGRKKVGAIPLIRIKWVRCIASCLLLLSFASPKAVEPGFGESKNEKPVNSEISGSPDSNKIKKLINRKVVILDFVNLKNSADYEYLETSIPEAISSSLDKTKKFEIMDRGIWADAVKSGKYSKKDAFEQSKATEFARSCDAEVILIGAFVAEEGTMQIFARVVEVESQRVMINRREKSALDTSMFDAIDNLSVELSGEMTQKLPPLEQKVVIVQSDAPVNWDNKRISVSLAPGFFINDQFTCGICEVPVVINARFWIMNLGIPGTNSSQIPDLLRGIFAGIKLDYTILWNGDGQSPGNSMGILDGVVFVGYGFGLGRFLFNADIGTGYFVTLNTDTIRNPLFETKLGAEILITPVFSAGLNIFMRVYHDNPSPMLFWGIGPVFNFVFGAKSV